MPENDLIKRLFLAVIGPLTVIVVINGVGTYYGQKSLNSAVEAMKATVANLPTKQDLKSSNKFLEYRLRSVERHQKLQDERINANHDAIMSEKRKQNSVWHPPYKRLSPHSMLTATIESRPLLRWIM